MRVPLALAALAAAVAIPLGCTSVLGDFSSGSAPGGPEGGGSDDGATASTDGSSGGSTDASSDVSTGGGGDSTVVSSDGGVPEATAALDARDAEAAAPLQLLTCNQWQNQNPKVIAQLLASDASGGGGNNQGPFNQFYLEHVPGMNAARIVVQTSTPSSTTTVYTVPESNSGSNAVGSLTLPGTGLQAELKTSSAVTFLVQQYMTGAYEYFSIADTDPGDLDASVASAQASIASSLPNQPSMGGGGNFRMSFVEMGPGSYYTLASYAVNGGQYDVASWLTTGQPMWQVVLGPGQELQIGSALVRNGTDVYGFFAPPGSGNGGPAALDQYTVSTTTSAAPTSRSIIPASTVASTIAASAGPNGANYFLAFVEIAGAQSANLRAGAVPVASINTFVVDDLPPLTFNVQSDGGFFDTTPFSSHNGGGARWLSNGDLGLLGGGGTGSGGTYTGLNFYVATATGQWLVETAGSGKNLLPGHTILGSAFDLVSAVNDILFQFDVAWVEQLADGSYALYFNQLTCQL